MAIKDSYTPKPTAPKIPAVIAKPEPVTRKGEMGGTGVATSKPVGSSGGGFQLSNQGKTDLGKDYKDFLAQMADIDKRTGSQIGGGYEGDNGGGGNIPPIAPPVEDPGLAYQKMQDEKNKRNAFALLKDVFTQYGLGELGATLETLMKEGYEPEEATLALKTDVRYNAPYIARFRGNELRRSAGLNVLSEAEYLTLEDDYTKTLKSYGLENYFGATKTAKQTAIADVIGADISAIEFTDRVSTAVDRVKMADPATKNAFQQFYGIGEADLVNYFLDPKKALVNLKEKATAAEIGGAAIGQGLSATSTIAEDLAAYGINREQAQLGYSQIGEELPIAGSLGRIYGESGITYNQADAESATFKGLASAKRKKEQLKQLEEGSFSGSSGTSLGQGSLSTQYLRKGSSSGQF